jgi:P27 family predicted phage terminase small subunit
MSMPAKSEAEHWLQGNKSSVKAVDFACPPGKPKCPAGISKEAKATFKRLCGLLEKRRALTEGDGELLKLYALNSDLHERARAKVAEQGEIRIYTRLDSNGTAHDCEKENLWQKQVIAAQKNMVAILDRLGLSPINRGRVKPTASTKKEADADRQFDEFLAKKAPLADSFDAFKHGAPLPAAAVDFNSDN